MRQASWLVLNLILYQSYNNYYIIFTDKELRADRLYGFPKLILLPYNVAGSQSWVLLNSDSALFSCTFCSRTENGQDVMILNLFCEICSFLYQCKCSIVLCCPTEESDQEHQFSIKLTLTEHGKQYLK